jgi:Aerotolerance regulator N-terminal
MMGGLGVISTGFLAAGAALATVPIVLHLLFRRKAPRVDLGSLRFLRIALKDNAHRRKVRRWLLLALRMAGILLLGLLFARPYSAKPAVPGNDREIAVLIDRSASMGAGGPNRSAYAKARDAVSKLLAGLPDGTVVHLATFDESGVTPIPSGIIEDVPKKEGLTGTEFAKGIAWARDRVVQSRRKLREVHLFTDLQRSGLEHPSPDPFPTGIDVEVVDVGRTLRGNLAVAEARAVVEEIREGAPPLISALVFNAGAFVARGVEVRLTLEGPGGKFQLTEKVDVAGTSRREVRFRPDVKKPGLYRGSVEVVSDDELPFDNLRHLAFEARRPESVLLVDGEPGASVFSNDTYFLESTLRLRLPGAGPSATPFDPRRIAWEGGANWPSLAETRVVVLANVGDVPIAVADSLKRFVEGGGRLVLFSGSKVGLGSLGSLRKIGLLPAEVEGVVDGPTRFESWDSTHPMLGPFEDPQHGDLRSLSFARLARLKPLEGSRVLASTKGSLPLLVEARSGAGLVLQWASAANNDWGEWAIQRLYLPLMHQMMGYLTGRLPGSGLVQPAGLEPGTTPGIEVSGLKLLVRNGDPAESRIDRAPLAEFRASLKLPEATPKPPAGPEVAADRSSGETRPGEFWRGVAWALLAILVVETFVANRTYA